MAAANVVEVVVKADNQTAAGFDAAKASAGEVAVSMDELTAAENEQAAAQAELESKTAALAAVLADEEASAAELSAAETELAAAQAKAGAAAESLSVAADKVAAAQARAADAARTSGDTQAAAAAKTTTAAKESADAQTVAGDAAVASGVKSDESAGLMAGAGAKVQLAGVAAAVGIGLAVKGAMDFQASTTRLVTSAGESASALGTVRQGMLSVSAQTDESTSQMAAGMYTIESAGFHGANGLTVLKAAAQGAKDEGAELSTVSNAVTDALVDFHQPASDAANVTSQLIAAVSHGKTTFEEFSGSMSTILPLASAMHLQLSDVTGVLSEMTAHGISARQAADDEANAMRSLMKPNAAMVTEFTKLGISSDEVYKKLGTAGLGGTLQWLSGVAQDGAAKIGQNYTEALGKAMGTAPGLQVALATTGENAKATNAAIAGIGSATADASGNVDGFSQVSQTLSFKMGAAEQSIKATGISLGEALLPAVTAVMGPITSMLQLVASNKVAADGFALVVGGVLATALGSKLVGGLRDVKAGIEGVGSGAQWLVGKLMAMTGAQEAQTAATEAATVAQGELDVAEDANPIGLIILAIVAVIAAIVLLVTHLHDVAHVFDIVRHDVAAIADGLWHDVTSAFTGLLGDAERIIGAVVSWVESHWALLAGIFLGPIALVVTEVVQHWDQISSATTKLISDVTGFFSKLWSDVTGGVAKGISAVTGDVSKWFSDWVSDTESNLDKIISFFAGLPGRTVSALGDMGSLLLNAGKAVIQGLINGITSMVSSVTSTVSSVVDDIKSFLPFSPAKRGPLSGSGSPENSGKSIARLLASGIASGAPDVQAAMQRLTGPSAGGQSASSASAAAAAAAAAGGTMTHVVQLEIAGGDDGILRGFRQAIRTRGGNVQAVLGNG